LLFVSWIAKLQEWWEWKMRAMMFWILDSKLWARISNCFRKFDNVHCGWGMRRCGADHNLLINYTDSFNLRPSNRLVRPNHSVTWPKVKRICIIYYQIMICPVSPQPQCALSNFLKQLEIRVQSLLSKIQNIIALIFHSHLSCNFAIQLTNNKP
jgi:hypothetical protein